MSGHLFTIKGKERGFSILEVLVVIAIISILAYFAITGFKNMATSHGVSQAASDAASLLELARSEAIARQTYTWVAFKNETNSGVLELLMVAIGSADGTTNANATNLFALSRLMRARNCGLTNYSALKSETKALSPIASVADLSSNDGITYSNKLSQFKKNTITFTPRGQAMLVGSPSSTDGFEPAIGIGFLPARGDTINTTSQDDAGVVVDGSTGSARVLRL